MTTVDDKIAEVERLLAKRRRDREDERLLADARRIHKSKEHR